MSGVELLAQFAFRMSFGLAVGMAVTSPRQVTSGYFRNHLYVLLGMNVLAALVGWSLPNRADLYAGAAAAALSYVGAVCWLYEKPKPGIVVLWLVAVATLIGAWGGMVKTQSSAMESTLYYLDGPTSGLVLGITLAAMFLGHWYLNTPTMALAPLQRLILLMAGAVVLRAIVCAAGLALLVQSDGWPPSQQLIFLSLRWLSGIVGALALAYMAVKTLQIPNTQSATGILYVAVIATFLGELTSLLMSAGSPFPI